jgi:hypothetical protein
MFAAVEIEIFLQCSPREAFRSWTNSEEIRRRWGDDGAFQFLHHSRTRQVIDGAGRSGATKRHSVESAREGADHRSSRYRVDSNLFRSKCNQCIVGLYQTLLRSGQWPSSRSRLVRALFLQPHSTTRKANSSARHHRSLSATIRSLSIISSSPLASYVTISRLPNIYSSSRRSMAQNHRPLTLFSCSWCSPSGICCR